MNYGIPARGGLEETDANQRAMALSAPVADRPRRGAATRREIVAVARTLFGQRCYAAVGMEEVAKLAGLTRRTVYNHFADKADLFREMHDQSLARLSQLANIRVPTNRPSIEMLGTLVEKIATLLTDDDHLALLASVVKDGEEQPWLIQAYRDNVRDPLIQAVEVFLLRLAHEGDVEVQDPRRTAADFLSLLEGRTSMPRLLRAKVNGSPVEGLVELAEGFLASCGVKRQAEASWAIPRTAWA